MVAPRNMDDALIDEQLQLKHVPSNVLVTGGCGFIGSNFVNFIFERWPQAKIVNFDKLAPGASAARVLEQCRNSDRYQLVVANLSDAPVVQRVLAEHKFDTIVHFAALTHVDESYADPIGYMQENTVALTVMLEAIREYAPLKKFVHISTDEVYGDCVDCEKPKDENCPMDPTNPYSASKAACELLLKSYWYSYKVPYAMVRMNNVYGPRQYHSKLIPKFVRLAIEGKPFTVAGDGTPKRSWMFVEDCAEAICRVTEHAKLGQLYNIGTDFELSNLELTEKIHATVSRLMGRQASKPRLEFIADRPHNDQRYWIDFGKIRRELGWHCVVPFDDGLTKTVVYYIEHWGKEKLGEKQKKAKKQLAEVEEEESETDDEEMEVAPKDGRSVQVVA